MNRLKWNALTNIVGSLSVVPLALLFTPVYLRILGAEVYGLVGLSNIFVAVSRIVDMGFSTALNREMARLSATPGNEREQHNLIRTLETLYWGGSLFIGGSIVLLSPIFARYWLRPERLSISTVQSVLMMMGIAIACQFPSALYQGGLLGLQRQVAMNVILIGTGVLRSAGAAGVLVWVSATAQGFFLWQLFVSLLQVILYRTLLLHSLPRIPERPRFDKPLLGKIGKFSAGMGAISVTSLFLTNADNVVISKLCTLEVFGYYTLAWAVGVCANVIANSISMAAFPRFSQMIVLGEEEPLTQMYHKASGWVSAIMWPIVLGISLFSKEVLAVWTSNPRAIQNVSPLLSVLIVGAALNGLMFVPYQLQMAYGWTRLVLSTNIVAVCVLVPALVLLVMRYGPIGAAWVWVGLNAAYVCIIIQLLHRKFLIGEKWKWYTQDVLFPLLASAALLGMAKYLLQSGSLAGMDRLGLGLYVVGAVGAGIAAASWVTPATRPAWGALRRKEGTG